MTIGEMWLRWQDLDKVRPDAFWFPNYSQQFMESMRREAEALLRLARDYGIPGVPGDAFRRVDRPGDQRQGVLGHGSALANG
ncbi:MAG: hypothetical protein IH968_10185 [Gemmatimonadetes bacterium]|nr:hypothetical protein [Gemmatimonadota bacterium]